MENLKWEFGIGALRGDWRRDNATPAFKTYPVTAQNDIQSARSSSAVASLAIRPTMAHGDARALDASLATQDARIDGDLVELGPAFNSLGRVQAGCFRLPKPTALLTHEGLLIRDSESFGPRFRGSRPTLMVAFGPRFTSLETESSPPADGSAETLAGKPLNAKRPAADLSASGVN